MEAQIPPPIMSHVSPRIKKILAESLFLIRLTNATISKITGGPKVNKKHAAIKVPIPSIGNFVIK
jgi:hypothetical protein